MTRQKVKLAFITNDSSRKATYKKRKNGLMKKLRELTTLCGIDACAVIHSAFESQPLVWPNTLGVQRVLAQFQRVPEMEKGKKMMNQDRFIKQQIGKASQKLNKQCQQNREKEVTELMYQCLTGTTCLQNRNLGDLYDLAWVIDQKMKEMDARMALLKTTGVSSPSSSHQIAPAVMDTGVTTFHDQFGDQNPNVMWPQPGTFF